MTCYVIKQAAGDQSWVVEFSPYNDGSEATVWYTSDNIKEVCMKIGSGGDVEEFNKEYPTPFEVAKNLKHFMQYDDKSKRAIDVIKSVRAIANCGLKEAKDAFDEVYNAYYG